MDLLCRLLSGSRGSRADDRGPAPATRRAPPTRSTHRSPRCAWTVLASSGSPLRVPSRREPRPNWPSSAASRASPPNAGDCRPRWRTDGGVRERIAFLDRRRSTPRASMRSIAGSPGGVTRGWVLSRRIPAARAADVRRVARSVWLVAVRCAVWIRLVSNGRCRRGSPYYDGNWSPIRSYGWTWIGATSGRGRRITTAVGVMPAVVVLDSWTNVGTGLGVMGIGARLRQLVPAWLRQPAGFRTLGGSQQLPGGMGGRSTDVVWLPRVLRQSPRGLTCSSSTRHNVHRSADGARRSSRTVETHWRHFFGERRRGSKAKYTSTIIS